ncbi:MAG TPA: ABC transporter substrate-binding protein [Methylomirabilota bacterium]|nr:ABC transporter substrate-binding protein [Methylomirabilota bacterium]
MSVTRLAAALLTLAALATSAMAQPKAPGVTDTEIAIGVTGPLTGPAALYGNLGVAQDAWARYVNDQGGVHGRKIRVVIRDDAFNPGRAMANLRELKDATFLNLGMVGSAIANAAKDEVAEWKFPVVNPYVNVQIWARQPREKLRYIFVAYPDYADETDFLVAYAANTLGAKNIAAFYQNDEWGKGAMVGVNRGIGARGGKATLAAAVSYEVTDRELATHALKLKESGADTLLLCSLNTHAANLVKEMAKVGYRPRLMGSFTIGDHVIMYRLLGELWEGAYFNVIGATVGEAETKPILDILMKYEPKLVGKEATALAGASAMILAVEGLKKAGRNLTRESFVEGMEGIKGFTTMGLSGPVAFGPTQHHGINAVRLMRAKKAADLSYEQVTGYQVFKPLF